MVKPESMLLSERHPSAESRNGVIHVQSGQIHRDKKQISPAWGRGLQYLLMSTVSLGGDENVPAPTW